LVTAIVYFSGMLSSFHKKYYVQIFTDILTDCRPLAGVHELGKWDKMVVSGEAD